jgi:hypothetical protein
MGKKTTQIMVYREVGNYELGLDVFYKKVHTKDPKVTCAQIKSFINSKQIDVVNQLLSEDFIYPECLKKNSWFNLFPKEKDTLKEEYETYVTCPFLEVIFFEYQELFYSLLSAVVRSKDQKIYELFINKLENTDIPKHIFTKWDGMTTKNIRNGIMDIERYSGKLLKEQSEKGYHALALARNLNSLIINPPNAVDKTAESKLEWLHFKLTFLKELHSKDEIFALHRGWKKIIANLVSLILTGCLMNVVKYYWTKNSVLCDKTESQKKVENLHHIINPGNWFKHTN